MQTATLNVTGMTSEASAPLVIQALTRVAGVQTVKVSYAEQNAIVEFDDRRTATPELLAALAQAGFSRDLHEQAQRKQQTCCGGCCH